MEDNDKTKVLAHFDSVHVLRQCAHDAASTQDIPPGDLYLQDVLIAMVTKHSNPANVDHFELFYVLGDYNGHTLDLEISSPDT